MSESPKVTALAPWFGSNRTLAEHVGDALRDCPVVAIPFAGGMSELVYIGARTLLVNDKHKYVVTMARCLAHPILGPKIYRQLRRVPFHPDILSEAQAWCKVNMPDEANKTEAAFYYFISCWMARNEAGVKGEFDKGISVRYDAGGGDSAVRFRSATRSLVAWRKILSRATFSTLDVFEFLGKIKDVEGHGIFADPPFPGPGDKYLHTFTKGEHERLSKTLAGYSSAQVVCRFYDVPMIRELYPEDKWTWTLREGRKQTNDKAPEVLLTNERAEFERELFE